MKEVNEVQVVDRGSFIQFLSLLHKDYLQNSAQWENRNLDSFSRSNGSLYRGYSRIL
ncbi:DUF7660 family protein [Puia sp. P3]|uniref:DUF7660 family protein n=1 Tax=Puia sp. P3 TaxID=3423952 RepID=UPI003D67DC15